MIRRTFKYRLYRSKRDVRLVAQIHVAASIWNHFVALTRRYYALYGKYPGLYALKRHLTKLRRESSYWQRLGSQACQDVIIRLDKAYQKFFSIPRAGRPGFKKRHRYTSFTLTQAGWKLLGEGRLRVGGTVYKYVSSRPVSGTIKTVTIKRDRCGDLWVCFSVVEDRAYPAPHEAVMRPAGLDFGLKTFLTTSSSAEIKSPELFKRGRREIAKLHRALSRKEKGSNKRRAARRRLARAYRRISDQRRDYFFKLAHALTDEYDFIAIEDLNLDGMKRLWGRKVSDLAFYEFVQILEYVALRKGVHVRKVERYYASTKLCSACGEKSDALTLSDRYWRCGCGAAHDRDVNAANNILDRASSSWQGEVRRTEKSSVVAWPPGRFFSSRSLLEPRITPTLAG